MNRLQMGGRQPAKTRTSEATGSIQRDIEDDYLILQFSGGASIYVGFGGWPSQSNSYLKKKLPRLGESKVFHPERYSVRCLSNHFPQPQVIA